MRLEPGIWSWAALLLLGGCTMNLRPDEAQLRTGMSQEEMDAAPGHHEMKAAILTDVRKWRMLDQRLEEGRAACPGITWNEKSPVCTACLEPMEVYTLKKDPVDQPAYRIDETAYYCRKESQYYYHYVGGKKKLDVWLGPHAIARKRAKPEE